MKQDEPIINNDIRFSFKNIVLLILYVYFYRQNKLNKKNFFINLTQNKLIC